MTRRPPTLFLLALGAAVGLTALGQGLTAQPPQPPAASAPASPETLRKEQEETLKLYRRFAEKTLELAQRWEKSDIPEERERAKTLRAALKLAEERGVENLFKDLVEGLSRKTPDGTHLGNLIGTDTQLLAALREILRTLQTESEAERLKREIAELRELIKEVERLKREQENIRARTDLKSGDPNRLAKDQGNLAKQTQDVADKIGKKDGKSGDSKAGKNETKNDKKGGSANAGGEADKPAEPKPEAKPGDTPGEPKADTGEDKSGDKDPVAGEGQPKESPKGGSEARPSPGKGADPDAGSARENPMAGMPPDAAGSARPPGDPKAGDPKAGDPKAGDPKAGDPKAGDPKAGDPKAGDPKAGGPRAGDPKASPPGESKAQGEGKGEGKPSDGQQAGQGKPMGDQKSGGDAQANSKPSGSSGSQGSQGSQGNQGNQGQQNPDQQRDPAQQAVEDAVPPQRGAEEDLRRNDRENASKKEDEAIKKLEEALKELEKRLAQLREKEKLKLLGALEERVNRMLAMQIDVREATRAIDAGIKKNGGQRTTADVQKAGVQAEKESDIVVEADKALKLLEGEGTGVVFAGVLAECKKDMEVIQKLLDETRVGEETQLIEEQVIAQLKRMLEALKRAKQDLENPPPPPPPGQPNPNQQGNRSLIKLVEELKLIRELQIQVNERTVAFHKLAADKVAAGEQVADPFLRDQIQRLGERQKVLQDMLHKIATGQNQ
jgi:hypothetical protein